MPFLEESTAPPFIIFQSQKDGVRLKAKSASAARSKIDGLLACAESVEIDCAWLYVAEPCSRATVEAFFGPMESSRGGSRGGFSRDDVAEVVARAGHALDDVATESWERFGVPRYVGFRQDSGAIFHVVWSWEKRDGVPVETFEAWHAFLVQHDALDLAADTGAYGMRVELFAEWQFRLRSKSAGVAGDPYPRSRMFVYLAGRRQYANMQLVLPYDQAKAAFRADHKMLNKALQVELPLNWFKLSRPPKKQGGRRSFGKLK